ncbi:MAG: cupin domain-containing protein [Nitrososphaerales archaeon]
MERDLRDAGTMPRAVRVAAGQDRFGERRGLGVSEIAFKVTPADSGGVLVLENTFSLAGGPARHLHHEQDEWFYVAEGEFVMEVGAAHFTLLPGDSVLGPRGVPHVWAFTGKGGASSGTGRIVIAFFPAGQMEAFFREVTKANAMPPQDPALWRAHGMELLGPPIALR